MNNENYPDRTPRRRNDRFAGFYSGYNDVPIPVGPITEPEPVTPVSEPAAQPVMQPVEYAPQPVMPQPMPAPQPVVQQRPAPAPQPEIRASQITWPQEPANEKPVQISYNLWLSKIIEGRFAFVLALVLIVLIAALVPSGGLNRSFVNEQRDFFGDISSAIVTAERESVASIFELPPVYILPWGEQVNPEPAGVYDEYELDGITYHTYEDATISVKYWSEFLMRSDCHFAEVKIAHPTQLRSAYAGGEFDSSARYTPQDIANQINAVVAINADFCGYRNTGVIVRQNTLYRNKPNGWDVLLIDSNGDFHIMNDRDVESSGVLDEYEIVNSFEFGPSLVIDGEINIINPNSGCGETYNMHHSSPRTAIGQLDELTYLLCVVEGKSNTSWGVLTSQMAELMLQKGCVQAYNLDGGKSSTLIFKGEPMNNVLWGGQRVVSDILYFATALPEE